MTKAKYILILVLLSTFACENKQMDNEISNSNLSDTIIVKYVDFSCPGANWKLIKNKSNKKITDNYIFIEHTLKDKINTNEYLKNKFSNVMLIGYFDKFKGVPAKYNNLEEKIAPTYIFKYSEYKFIKEPEEIKKKNKEKKQIIDIKRLDTNEYEVKYQNKIIRIKELTYENLQGATILNPNNEKDIKAKIRFTFGINQYLTDDTPAQEIDYHKNSQILELPIINNTFCIPELNDNNESAIEIHKFLGYNNIQELNKWFSKNDLKKIKTLSIKKQKRFYKRILKNKKNFEKCCPEYIEQAKRFIQKDIYEYKNCEDLNLEIFVKEIEIIFIGKDLKFNKILISQNKR